MPHVVLVQMLIVPVLLRTDACSDRTVLVTMPFALLRQAAVRCCKT